MSYWLFCVFRNRVYRFQGFELVTFKGSHTKAWFRLWYMYHVYDSTILTESLSL
jgi:hypothetical protein